LEDNQEPPFAEAVESHFTAVGASVFKLAAKLLWRRKSRSERMVEIEYVFERL
jgi:hypothetical protein